MILDEKRIREIIRESLVSNEMSNLLNEKIGTSLKLGQATAIKVADSALTTGGGGKAGGALRDVSSLNASKGAIARRWKSPDFECRGGVCGSGVIPYEGYIYNPQSGGTETAQLTGQDNLAVGWGHGVGRASDAAMSRHKKDSANSVGITSDAAQSYLDDDINWAETWVKSKVQKKINTGMLNALVLLALDFCYYHNETTRNSMSTMDAIFMRINRDPDQRPVGPDGYEADVDIAGGDFDGRMALLRSVGDELIGQGNNAPMSGKRSSTAPGRAIVKSIWLTACGAAESAELASQEADDSTSDEAP
jgi:hypothetical protein